MQSTVQIQRQYLLIFAVTELKYFSAPTATEPPATKEEKSEDVPEAVMERITVREVIEGGPWKKDDEGHWKSTTIIRRIKFKPLPDPLIRAETIGTKWAYDGARWAPIPVTA